MKLAFYYHITISKRGDKLYCPAYFGVFLDSLAKKVDCLFLVLHQSNSEEEKHDDYYLKSSNVIWINLGLKTPVWHRDLFHRKILKSHMKCILECDAFIVRSPSPLAPFFHKYIDKQKLIFMVVGDYLESVKQWKLKSIRDWFELRYLEHNDRIFRKQMRKTDLMVNSPALYEKYKPIAKSISQIKTTTISLNDFFYRDDTCENDTIQLLFTGRIDPLKGLFDLFEAVKILIDENYKIRLNIVGWETELDKPVENELRAYGEKIGIEEYVIFHGFKTLGDELNRMYRMADIYVLPSHEEGFPRTIWEALANSLPVITTKVGGIPFFLTHSVNAFLIEPKRVNELVLGIKTIISDKDLRVSLIKNGLDVAKENTLEIQANRIIEITKKLLVN